ncbi:general amidase [Gymnopilus junonius]|uniref:amidase n=1 Tax=Gymnopilus junonius TaxID=109634 RepID=A0A9P5NN30_GYMJU|nr:general amidase [Gymnopilus junonius]
MAAKDWTVLATEKRALQEAVVPNDWILQNLPPKDTLNVMDFPENCGLLTAREIWITNTEVTGLLEKLSKGVWSAVEVTTAFAKRAVIAHQLVNCLTEIFIDRALKRAAELDEYLKTTGKVVGSLHGLPISFKDQVSIKGVESTIGYVSYIGRYAEKNAALVDVLESCGAIPYVKTNVPQTLMWGETYNHIFRRSLNPYNRSLTTGGSSGGEGALIALRGSPLGVGSDIAGSVRVPAAFNGLYGLRPSQGRVPYAGCVNTLEGQDSVLSVLGPISHSLGGIKGFIKGVVSQKPWLKDPLVVRKPWNEEEYLLADHGEGKQLCFGVMWDDEVVLPHPPIIRALQETKRALLAAGHQVIDWKPLKHGELNRALVSCSFASSVLCSLERLVDRLYCWRRRGLPNGAVSFGEPLIAEMYPVDGDVDRVVTGIPGHRAMPPGMSAYDAWQVQKKRRDLREEYLEHWNASIKLTGTGRPVDAIIAPAAHCTAPPHGGNRNVIRSTLVFTHFLLNIYRPPVYSMVWNALDYTALVLPTGLSVDPVLDLKKPPHTFFNDSDKANYELYDPEHFKGAPIAVQVVGRNLEEEAVIAMGEIVDSALKSTLQ